MLGFSFRLNTLRAWLQSRLTRPRHVLVVDDDLMLKPIFRRVFRRIDPEIRVHWATTVGEACELLSQIPYRMIIVDCLLDRGSSGLTLWRLCKENHPDLPFLMISGLSRQTIEKIEGPESRVPPFLAKPFLSQDCLSRIRDELARH
jgi:DNA-binding response OmpR family regulator